MATNHNLIKGPGIFRGINKSLSDVQRTPDYSSDMQNAQYRLSGAISKRKGHKVRFKDTQKILGSATYKVLDPSTGAYKYTPVVVSDKFQTMAETPIYLVNNTSEANKYCSLIPEEGNFRFKMFDLENDIFDISLGSGENAEDANLTSVKEQIESISTSTIILQSRNESCNVYKAEGAYSNSIHHLLIEVPISSIVCKNQLFNINNASSLAQNNPLFADRVTVTINATHSNTLENELAWDDEVPEFTLDLQQFQVWVNEAVGKVYIYTQKDPAPNILTAVNIEAAISDIELMLDAYTPGGNTANSWVNTGAIMPVDSKPVFALLDVRLDIQLSRNTPFPSYSLADSIEYDSKTANQTLLATGNDPLYDQIGYGPLFMQYNADADDLIFRHTLNTTISIDYPELTDSGTKAAFLKDEFFLPLTREPFNYLSRITLKDIPYGDISDWSNGSGTGFHNHLTAYTFGHDDYILGRDDYENPSFAYNRDVLYFSNGVDDVLKYDGESVFRAGLPTPEPIVRAHLISAIPGDPFAPPTRNSQEKWTLSNGIAAGVQILLPYDDPELVDGNGQYLEVPLEPIFTNNKEGWRADYMYLYEYTDAALNTITSERSETFTVDYVELNNLIGNDGVQNQYLVRFGIRLELPPIKARGFDYNSGRFKVKIYRTRWYNVELGQGPGQFYPLIYTNPDDNSSRTEIGEYTLQLGSASNGNTSQNTGFFNIPQSRTDNNLLTYVDFMSDYLLNPFLAYTENIKRHDPPPKGKYLTMHKNCLVIAGQLGNVNNVQFSLPFNAITNEIGSEYFPDDNNAVVLDAYYGGGVTGIGSVKDILFMFHKDTVHALIGDITDPISNNYSVDLVSKEGGIGCLSHSSIQEFQGQIVFMSELGLYTVNRQLQISELSYPIRPFLIKENISKNRCITHNLSKENLLLVLAPVQEKNSLTNTKYSTDVTKVFVFDYSKGAWLKWSNMDFTSGIFDTDIKTYLLASTSDGVTMYSRNTTDTVHDYNDGVEGIDFYYETAWESLGEPTIPKKFLRLKIYMLDTDGTFTSPAFDLNIALQRDFYDADVGALNVNLSEYFNGGWSLDKWGEDIWGSSIPIYWKSKLPTGKAKSTKLRFTNNKRSEDVLFSNYEFEVVAPYGVEIKD